MTSKSTRIYGMKVRTTSQRRFVAVVIRPVDVLTDEGTYVAFARVEARSDSWSTISKRAYGLGGGPGVKVIIWDTADGTHFDVQGREMFPADEDRAVFMMMANLRTALERRESDPAYKVQQIRGAAQLAGWSLVSAGEAEALIASGTPNPVVATRKTSDGGTARLYLDGNVDATDGASYSLSPGFETFEALEEWIGQQPTATVPFDLVHKAHLANIAKLEQLQADAGRRIRDGHDRDFNLGMQHGLQRALDILNSRG